MNRANRLQWTLLATRTSRAKPFSTNFPTVNPIQATNAGGGDSFVAKLNAAGNALVYSTYLGGSDFDPFPMIEIDRRRWRIFWLLEGSQ